MELLTTREFNGVALNCYKAGNQADGFWATREQIGKLLEYENPNDAIRLIHARHFDRLDKFSTSFKLNRVEGEREVEREVIFYNFKGFLEICRFSNQEKANAVMDFAWEVMDEIRRTGSYNDKLEAGKMLLHAIENPEYPLNECDRRKIISKAMYLISGVKLDENFYSCKDIAKELNITEKRVFNKALNAGIIKPEDNVYGFWDKNYDWFFTELGREKILEKFASLKYWWLHN